MNNSLLNASLTNNTINKKNTIDNDSDFFTFFLQLMSNNQHLLLLILYVLLIIFIIELLLIIYLQKKNKTLKQLCVGNCFNKRLKRKKNLTIQMGHLSHTIDIK
jgi:hypothetical protein